MRMSKGGGEGKDRERGGEVKWNKIFTQFSGSMHVAMVHDMLRIVWGEETRDTRQNFNGELELEKEIEREGKRVQQREIEQ